MSNFVENSIGVFPNLFTLRLCDPHCQHCQFMVDCIFEFALDGLRVFVGDAGDKHTTIQLDELGCNLHDLRGRLARAEGLAGVAADDAGIADGAGGCGA